MCHLKFPPTKLCIGSFFKTMFSIQYAISKFKYYHQYYIITSPPCRKILLLQSLYSEDAQTKDDHYCCKRPPKAEREQWKIAPRIGRATSKCRTRPSTSLHEGREGNRGHAFMTSAILWYSFLRSFFSTVTITQPLLWGTNPKPMRTNVI